MAADTKSQQISKKVLQKIENDGLDPTPEVYAVLYQYFERSDYSSVKSYEALTKSKESLTNEDYQVLHEQNQEGNKQASLLQKAESAAADTFQDLEGLIGSIGKATGEYSSTISQSNQDLSNIKDVSDLKKIVANIAQENKKMISKNKELEKELGDTSTRLEKMRAEVKAAKEEANTDALTTLTNRKGFDKILKQKTKDVVDDTQTLSLLMIDIDHFKKFNDTYGHLIGDQVLRLVSKTLVDSIKGKDTAARYGGEEFAVILPETNINAAIMVGNLLRKAVADKALIDKRTGGELARITISVGASQYIREEPIVDLIERADKALYHAKEKGRDRVVGSPKSGDFQYTAN